MQLISIILKEKEFKSIKSKDLFLYVSELLESLNETVKACDIMKKLFDVYGQYDKMVQSKYLNLLTDINISEAIKL